IEGGEEQRVGFSATYYPGSVSAGGAERIPVSVAQEGTADVALRRGRTAAISGTAVSATGGSLAGQTVFVVHEMPGTGVKAFDSGGAVVLPDGTFTLTNLPPGDLKLVMRYVASEGGGAP